MIDPEELRFLRSVIAEPVAIGSTCPPALIYADWLDEQGEDEEAAFWRRAPRFDGRPPPHRTAAFRRLVLGDWDWPQALSERQGGWLVERIENGTPLSPQQIDGWCEQLTAATGVPFSKRPRTKHRDDFVLSPARGVYVRMGEKPDDTWII